MIYLYFDYDIFVIIFPGDNNNNISLHLLRLNRALCVRLAFKLASVRRQPKSKVDGGEEEEEE